MSNTAPSRADPVVVFPLGRWCPPQETSQPHPPQIKLRVSRDLNSAKMHLWTKFGNPNLNRWWVMGWTSSKWGQFWLWSYIWPWRSRSITPKNNKDLNRGFFYTYGPNLVILAWMGDELSRGQESDYRTYGRTHRQTQPTTTPEGQNWPRVKMTSRPLP